MTGSGRRIQIGNTIVDGAGAAQALPTFMLNLLGLNIRAIESELADVAVLQSIAPTFRVVVLTDQPIFGLIRSFGWPVEHLPAPEHGGRALGPSRLARYVHARISIAESHFEQLRVVSAVESASVAVSIARSLQEPDVTAALDRLRPDRDGGVDLGTSWTRVAHSLETTGEATWEGTEGSVNLVCSGGLQPALLIVGTADAGPDLPLPAGVGTITVSFTPGASLALESHVYAELARNLRPHLTVVLPRDADSLLSDDVFQWVDLGVNLVDGMLVVRPEYRANYTDLSGTDQLIWSAARAYGIVRRASRALSSR